VYLSWLPGPNAQSYNVYRGTAAGQEAALPLIANNPGTNATDTSVTLGVTYYYKVASVNTVGQSALSSEVSVTPGFSPPAPPASVKATETAAAVSVFWSAVPGATSYNLYKGTYSGGEVIFQTDLTATSFIDKSVANGQAYYYYVASADSGGQGAVSAQVSAVPGGAVLPAPFPVSVQPVAGLNSVHWGAVANATSYNLYRGTVPGGEGTVPYVLNIGVAAIPYYSDSNVSGGTLYYYKVAALGPNGEGALSAEVSAKAGSLPLLAPAYLGATPENGSVSLYWSGVNGASYYNIYRGTSSGQYLIAYQTTSTSFVDKDVDNGTTYYYVVTAVNANGESQESPQAHAQPGTTAGTAPFGLAARVNPASDSISLYWNAVAGAVYYNVYRATASGGESAGTVFSVSANGSGQQTYTDTTPVFGTRYYYKVSAVTATAESAKSNEASATRGVALLPAVQLNTRPLSATSVLLQWSAGPGETAFDIFRGVNGIFETVGLDVSGSSFTDTGLAPGVVYTYMVAAVGPDGMGLESNAEGFTGGQNTLPAPGGFKGTPNSQGYVSLAWDIVSGADGYNIYRSTSSGSSALWAYQVANGNATSSIDGQLATGTYYYKISAYNPAEGTVSTPPIKVVVSSVPFGTPVLSATAASTSAILDWSAVPSATSYDLFRGLSPGGETLYKQNIASTSFTDSGLTSGASYYYYVCGVDSAGNGQNSNAVEVTAGGTAPHAPPAINVYPVNQSISVSWPAVAGATGYVLYRGVASGGEGSQPYAFVSGGTNASYGDTKVSVGVTYYYRVAALSIVGQSALSPEGSAELNGGQFGAPSLAADAGAGSVQLTWQAVTGATGYNVFRSTLPNQETDYAVSSGSATKHVDTSVTSGQIYYYRVSAFNSTGAGPLSNEAYATPGASGLPPAPAGLSAQASVTVGLSWNSVVGALSYNVYRGTASGQEGNAPYATNITSAAFRDYNVAPGTRYFYKVSAVNQVGEGPPSLEASATPDVPPLAAPRVLAATPQTGSIGLAWSPVAGATGYYVDRTNPLGSQFVLATVASTTTTYVDTSIAAADTYQYQVFAYDADGAGSGSPVVSAQDIDFALALQPSVITIPQGQSDAIVVGLASSGGFAGGIQLSVSGTPTGATASFYPADATVAGSNLYISAGTAALGTYRLTVTAMSGANVHTASFNLIVVAPGQLGRSTPDANVLMPERTDPSTLLAPARQLALPLPMSLLDSIGGFIKNPQPWQIQMWKAALHRCAESVSDMAQQHIWLGEVALAGDEDVATAAYHFAAVSHLKGVRHDLLGLARYDQAVTLFDHSTFMAAATAFKSLLASKQSEGYSRRNCTFWLRRAESAAGRQLEREAMGIPEPSHLDPECAAAALAICFHSLGLPDSRSFVLSILHVTGEGSTLQDIEDAARRVGMVARPVVADDEGLMALPKPAVAFVEHDHFVCLTGASRQGVTYVCSDCGPWPGGKILLSWKQWHALEPWLYATVLKPQSPPDRALNLALSSPLGSKGFDVASAGGVVAARWMSTVLQLAALHHLTAFNIPGRAISCGERPNSPQPPPHNKHNPKNNNGNCPCGGGPSKGDPVNLATGEEQYEPSADLTVYNPNGPSVTWSRVFNSLRSPNLAYEYADFGPGWSQPYNVGVYDASGGAAGSNNPKYVYFPNGAQWNFTASSVPSSTKQSVACTTQPGADVVVTWRYAAASSTGYYTVEFADRTVWTTTPMQSGTRSYVLSSITDRNGHSIAFTYGSPEPDGTVWGAPIPLLASIVDATSKQTLLAIHRAHDGTGNITFVTDNQGRNVLYHSGYYPIANTPAIYGVAYQQLDHASMMQSSLSTPPTDLYQYGYSLVSDLEGSEEVPFLTSMTVPSATGVGTASTSIQYSSEDDAVASITDANGNTHTYTSTDQFGNLAYPSSFTRVVDTDPENRVVGGELVGYDTNEDMTYQADVNGHMQEALSYTDPNDPFDPSSDQDAAGLTTTFTYDSFGNVTSSTSPKGTVTTNSYSYSAFPLGELVKAQTGTKSPTTYAYYEPSGYLKTISTPAPGTVGSATTVTTSYVYDSFGNMVSMTVPGNGAAASETIQFTYAVDGSYTQSEALNEPIAVKDNGGDTTHYRYNAFGEVSSTEDALNNVTSSSYDIAGNKLSVLYPKTGENGPGQARDQWIYLYPGGPVVATETYDESGNLTRRYQYTYGNEGETLGKSDGFQPEFYTYDGLYQIATIQDGKGNTTDYSYDVDGDLTSVRSPKGDTETRAYDTDDRIVRRVDARGIETDYAYKDGDGNLSSVSYPSAATLNQQYTYDAYDRQVSVSDGVGTYTSTYDDGNRLLTSVTAYKGVPAATLSYAYNPDGSRRSLTSPAGTALYKFDDVGRLASLTNPFGETSSISYYPTLFIDEVKLANGATSVYVPDARSSLRRLVNMVGSTTLSDFGGTTGIVRDSLAEPLTVPVASPTAALNGTTAYSVDGEGQLTEEKSTRNGGYDDKFGFDVANNPDLVRGVSATFDADDQNTALSYDASGDETSFPGTSDKAAYDVEQRVTSYGPSFTAGYRFDGLRAWAQSGATRTYFLYDGSQPVIELTSGGAVSAYNTFGPYWLLSRHTSAGSIFYQFDPFGNVAERTNSSGMVISSSVYDSFGLGASSATVTDPFGFGGQYGYYTDHETGLILLSQRYYDPRQARFVTRDPLGQDGDVNIYSYAAGNPLVWYDPDGTSLLGNILTYGGGAVAIVAGIIAVTATAPVLGIAAATWGIIAVAGTATSLAGNAINQLTQPPPPPSQPPIININLPPGAPIPPNLMNPPNGSTIIINVTKPPKQKPHGPGPKGPKKPPC
jgi:RHS repeat-associated protein